MGEGRAIMQTQEITPEVASKQALTVYDQAKAIKVIDNVTMTAADDLIKSMRLVRKEIGLAFDPIIAKAHAAHKEAKAQKDRAELPLIQAEEFLKPQIKKYLSDQEMIRLLEENRLRLEAQKAEEERRLAEAAQLEAEGHKEEAEAILDTPAPIVMPTVEKTTPKADMRLYRKVWKYRIINEADIPREYLTPDLIKIGGVVRALKGKCKISGVEVYEE
jgi:hypothetical protein